MALTAKPHSTISYNTKEFLLNKLNALYDAGRIEDYRVIFHIGELDEDTGEYDKDHAHVFIVPNRRLDTVELRREFDEVDFAHPEIKKPLGTLPWRASDPYHWLMYVTHDPVYLQMHNSDNDGDGKIPYDVTQIVTPFEEQLKRDFRRALELRSTATSRVVSGLRAGYDPMDICIKENYNPTQLNALLKIAEHSAFLSMAQSINNTDKGGQNDD